MIDWRAISLIAASACSALAMAQPLAPRRQSVFTKLEPKTCTLIDENADEGSYWLRQCQGRAGWKLEWSEGDLREDLDLIAPSGRKTELRLSELVAKGAFNSLGATVEWRGHGATKPDTLIVRISIANGPEPARPDISKLAVVKLTDTPCLVAIVEPGPRQNQKARKVADGSVPACLTNQ